MHTIFQAKQTKEKITIEELESQTGNVLPKREEMVVMDYTGMNPYVYGSYPSYGYSGSNSYMGNASMGNSYMGNMYNGHGYSPNLYVNHYDPTPYNGPSYHEYTYSKDWSDCDDIRPTKFDHHNWNGDDYHDNNDHGKHDYGNHVRHHEDDNENTAYRWSNGYRSGGYVVV